MTTLTKSPEEARKYAFDFSEQKEIAEDGQTLASATTPTAIKVTGTGTLTISNKVLLGSVVSFDVSGGDDHSVWEIRGTATTSAGAVLAAVGRLNVLRE